MSLWVPNKDKDGKRTYGSWAGNPHGTPEDKSRCIWEVPNNPGWGFQQCSRKRGHGPEGEFCKQHGKKAEAS